MPCETELVTILSRTPIRSRARNRVLKLLDERIEWSQVLALATAWHVEPTVFGNLGSEFSGAMPATVRAEVAAREKQSRVYAMSRTLMLLDLLQTLEKTGISAIVLKGPAIAIAGYDDASRRTFSDADLLLRQSDLRRARDLLLGHGYSPLYSREMESRLIAGQHALEFADSRTSVELHWALLSRHLRFDLDVDDLWSQSQLTQCLGSEIRTLSPEHLFLYLCAHGAKHEWAVFRWICDIAQLAERLSSVQAKRVMALAQTANAKRILALGLRLVREIFGESATPFPDAAFGRERETARLVELVRTRLTSDNVARGLLPRRIASIHQYMEPLAFWLSSRERMTDRLACAADFVFVPAPGDSSHGRWQHVFRPLRLAANALRRLAHAS